MWKVSLEQVWEMWPAMVNKKATEEKMTGIWATRNASQEEAGMA
jgi:hypothetical protein